MKFAAICIWVFISVGFFIGLGTGYYVWSEEKHKILIMLPECDMDLQKQPKFISKTYTSWVCTNHCVVCGEPGHDYDQIVPHHIKGIGHLSGGALKAPDNWTMPMHATCHTNWHADAKINQDLLENQWEWVARTQAAAIVAIANGELKL